jgi:hypothetical protein
MLLMTIPVTPGTAVQLDEEREGARALWLMEARQQGRVAVPEIFDVFDGNVVRLTGADGHGRLLFLGGTKIRMGVGYTW